MATPTGGTITTNGNKTVHTFLTGDNFIIPAGMSGNVEVLVVAGGGGGAAGGGGGGGLLYNASFAVSAQTYTVTIGAGGAGKEVGSVADSGNNSVFSSLTAIGGGGGNSTNVAAGIAGGSGGGGGASGSIQTYGGDADYLDPRQGYDGGGNANEKADPYPSGGGGGAGGVGGDATSSTAAGIGGIGLEYSISGSATDYAGGGGGWAYNGASSGGTAVDGGGAGKSSGGNAGTANTGGGGGATNESGTPIGGAGGSGIVIISYITADFAGVTANSIMFGFAF